MYKSFGIEKVAEWNQSLIIERTKKHNETKK